MERTRARLRIALRQLIQERPLKNISVQDVIKLAQVSRSAFYAHYDGKVDLLLSDMDEFLEQTAMWLFRAKENSNRVAPVREFFSHVGQSKQIRGALLRSGRLQDFFALAHEHFARGIEARLQQITSAKSLSVLERSLLSHAIAGAFFSLLNCWIEKSQPCPAETIDALFHEFVWTGLGLARQGHVRLSTAPTWR